MPTLLVAGKFRFVMYLKDHNPPHVHVIGPDCGCKVSLKTLEVTHVRGLSKTDVKRILLAVNDYIDDWLELWREIHD